MAKRRKMLPARKPRDRSRDDDALLLRSAESLGRMIGALQRQLDGATKRLSAKAGEVIDRTSSGQSWPEAAKADYGSVKRTKAKTSGPKGGSRKTKRAASRKGAARKTTKRR